MLSPQASPFDSHALDEFYARISAEGGVDISSFQHDLANLFTRPRSEEDLRDYWLHKKPWKKLSDEIVPVSTYLLCSRITSGRVRFSLNDQIPDAWLSKDDQDERIGIEVTIAQARERYYLAKELVNDGLGRGFIGVSDDASSAEFESAMAKERIAYTSDQALTEITKGIIRCLNRKNKQKFSDHILLIQAPLLSLPEGRWLAATGSLASAAEALPFRQVFVVSNGYDRRWGFQIK